MYYNIMKLDFGRQQDRSSTPIIKLLGCMLRRMITRQTWTMKRPDDKISGTKTEYIGDNTPLSPNLSTCHSSLSCCPTPPESELPVTEFEFPKQQSPLRVRRPAHLLDDAYIAKYEKAIAIMRQLPPDHPHNFRRQANLHCIYCTGAYEQESSRVPLGIHRSWLFFPWHRMHIYFHERIVGKLVGDETFALPYWNWDSPDGMAIPEFYLYGSFNDPDRDVAHLPRAIANLDYTWADDEASPQDQIATNLAFMYNQMVSGARKLELFMGCRLRPGEAGQCDGPGTIENAPHNALHSWVGSARKPNREDMGVFYSAARDPIFYAHHSNIDRMWTIWKKLNGKRAEISDPQWLDSHFYFYDENARLVRIKVRDCLDTTRLGYVYEEADLPWLSARPKPSVDPKIGRSILRSRIELCKNFGHKGPWSVERTVRVIVARPKRPRDQDEEEVLLVYGVDVMKDMYVKFDILINAVDETTVGPRSREFAGSFVKIPSGARVADSMKDLKSQSKHNLKLGISELLADIEADQDESILVTLVPRLGSGINTTVDGIRIEYMK